MHLQFSKSQKEMLPSKDGMSYASLLRSQRIPIINPTLPNTMSAHLKVKELVNPENRLLRDFLMSVPSYIKVTRRIGKTYNAILKNIIDSCEKEKGKL
jgi:hypothetical protein